MSKALLILTLALMVFWVSCADHSTSQMSNAGVSQRTPEPAKTSSSDQPSEASQEIEKKLVVPVEFRNVEFKNLSYPISLRRKRIKLSDGKHEYGEGSGGNSFELQAVDYTDLNGDGSKEAVVTLFQLSCGGSCDGGSYLFYFYSMRRGRLLLLSRIETGSLGYGECGLRSFALEKGRLILEVFHVCRFEGTSLKNAYDPHPNPDAKVGKFTADKFTRFSLEFEGTRFVLTKRDVLPNPQEEIMNYRSKIEVGND